MSPKQLLFIGVSTAVVGGGATGTYFLMSEKKETETANKDAGEVVKKITLRTSLSEITFLKTNDNTNNDTWGKLIDKFHELGSSGKAKISANIATKVENPSNKDANIEVLKKACDTLLEKTDFQEEDKTIAKNWCSSNTTLLTTARPDSSTTTSIGPQ